jgi:hypothetical protein
MGSMRTSPDSFFAAGGTPFLASFAYYRARLNDALHVYAK